MNKITGFRADATEFYKKIVQLNGILELENDLKSIQARTRAETAAKLLKELPDTVEESTAGLRKKILPHPST